jgi:hypothetical protein
MEQHKRSTHAEGYVNATRSESGGTTLGDIIEKESNINFVKIITGSYRRQMKLTMVIEGVER